MARHNTLQMQKAGAIVKLAWHRAWGLCNVGFELLSSSDKGSLCNVSSQLRPSSNEAVPLHLPSLDENDSPAD